MNIDSDISYLKQALEFANIKRGFCFPNPSVGAVVVDQNNQILSTGYHAGPGLAHAEIIALQNLKNQKPHTIYVTLEPCCHWGRTPPCTEALIKAGVKRVVFGFRDPNPLVNGQGQSILQTSGIQTDYISLPEIDLFYQSYRHWHLTKKPYVTAKIALSLNGAIAGQKGERIQITGKELHCFTHMHRKLTDAILTTIDTILTDDPQLNARCENNCYAKDLYILDTHLRTPKTAAIFHTAKSITLFHASNASLVNKQTLIEQGARCISIDNSINGLNLNQILDLIGQDGVHDLWVEAGGKCFSSFVKEKLLQKALIYIAPRWLSAGKIAFPEGISLADAQNIHWQSFGNDALCEIHW